MNRRILYLLSWGVALLMALPAVAQEESTVTLSGNGYITAAPEGKAFIDDQRCELRNWNDTGTVVSFYFRTEKSGKMNVALNAKGYSQIEVSILGKKKKVRLDSDSPVRVEVGTFKVKNPGYVKMDIRGVKINKGESFGNIESVAVGGDVAPVVCVSPEFSAHFGRRGPSVHLGYALPEEDVEWFYNEVTVPEEGDLLYGLWFRPRIFRYAEQ